MTREATQTERDKLLAIINERLGVSHATAVNIVARLHEDLIHAILWEAEWDGYVEKSINHELDEVALHGSIEVTDCHFFGIDEPSSPEPPLEIVELPKPSGVVAVTILALGVLVGVIWGLFMLSLFFLPEIGIDEIISP